MPEEVKVTDCVVVLFTLTLPKARLVVLRLSAGAAITSASNCKAKLSEVPSAVAVSVAVCDVLTEEAVAKKPALLAPAATVTEAGTDTDELLLARLTVSPPLGAAVFSVTVQLSVPAPVIDPLAQLNEVRFVMFAALAAEVPVPLSEITIVPLAVESLVMVN